MTGPDAPSAHHDGARLDGTALDRLRPLAFSVAYRMLGSVAEAEDVVQEALTRLSQADGVRNPDAFVTTVTTRIAIDVLRSARVRRESYVGEWLPEPLVGPAQANLPVAMAAAPPDAAAHAELADDLSTAFLVLLETLTPTERAAFLLHDVLGYPHSDAADIIGTSEVAARQLASRARRRIARQRGDVGHRATSGGDNKAQDNKAPHSTARDDRVREARVRDDRARAEQLVTRFLAACEEGEVDAFLELLAQDVVLTGDSGGNVPPGMSIVRPVAGQVAVARALAGFMRRGAPIHFERALVGGGPGLLIVADDAVGGGLIGTWSFEVSGGQLRAIRGVINPEKLRHLGPLADLVRLHEWLRGARRRTAR
ncbi:sigma-70 family RNA polymerase sigma factor [Promicromonospora sp. NPDC057138]|uniref:sigma-70 family RNA polymerase sigma factor n=1 Tax=Promicromonospora sp. NPDC057138 TaxID=3346031 RepID=UPI003644F136